MNSASSILSREYGPLGIFGTIASGMAGPATSAMKRLCSPQLATKPVDAPAKSPAQLRYEADTVEVGRIAGEQRNIVRGLSLCGVVALCGASAFMQLAVIFWPLAVVMIWGAAEAGWALACEWYEGRKAYQAAVAQQRASVTEWIAVQEAEKDDGRQQRYQEAVRSSQLAAPRLGPATAMALRPPAAASATQPQNH